jgi:hypothetical protein
VEKERMGKMIASSTPIKQHIPMVHFITVERDGILFDFLVNLFQIGQKKIRKSAKQPKQILITHPRSR